MTFPLLVTWLDAKSCTWGGSASRVQGDDAETFEVVLPIVEIQSASRFDITRYDQLNP